VLLFIEIDEIFEDDLPYDLSQEVINLDNTGYGIWYLDCMDHPQRYEGKKIRFTAQVLLPEKFPKGYFVPGRMAMTCCADDKRGIMLCGILAKWSESRMVREINYNVGGVGKLGYSTVNGEAAYRSE
jgi:hypothetical protein